MSIKILLKFYGFEKFCIFFILRRRVLTEARDRSKSHNKLPLKPGKGNKQRKTKDLINTKAMAILKSQSTFSSEKNDPENWKDVENRQKKEILEKEKNNLKRMLENYEREIETKKSKLKKLKIGSGGKVEKNLSALRNEKKNLKKEIQEIKNRVNRTGTLERGKSYQSLKLLRERNKEMKKKERKKSAQEDGEESKD